MKMFHCCFSLLLLPFISFVLLGYASQYTHFVGTFPLTTIGLSNDFDIDTFPMALVQGRTYLVTGANSGLGYETAKMLLEKGGTVVLTCRTKEKFDTAVGLMGLTQEQEKNAVFVQPLELSSLASVKSFVDAYLDSDLKLDVLILNAGVFLPTFKLSEDGIEQNIAVNHFSHAALTLGLLDRLLDSEYIPRVVVVSSLGHASAPQNVGVYLSLDQLNDPNLFDGDTMYGQSKLANWYFGVELQRRLNSYTSKNVLVNVVHPGLVITDVGRNLDFPEILKKNSEWILGAILKLGLAWGPKEGALTQVAVAIDPRIEQQNIKAKYFVPIFNQQDTGLVGMAHDYLRAKKVWEFTIELLNQKGFSFTL